MPEDIDDIQTSFFRASAISSRARAASICSIMDRCFLALLQNRLDPSVAQQTASLLALFEGLSSFDRQAARRWHNTLTLSRNPSKVGRSLAQAKNFFGEHFSSIAAILLAERISRKSAREAQAQADSFEQDRQCLALAIKAAKDSPDCWKLLSVGEAVDLLDTSLAKTLLRHGFPAAGVCANGETCMSILAKSHSAWMANSLETAKETMGILLSNGCSPDDAAHSLNCPLFERLPLGQAISAQRWSMASLLLDAGADGFVREGPSSPMLLEQAAKSAPEDFGARCQSLLEQRELGAAINSASLPRSGARQKTL